MATVYGNWLGTMKQIFKIGGPLGKGFKLITEGLAAVDADDNLINLQIERAAQDDHAATWLDVKEAGVLVEFAIDGNSPPSPGTNSGSYGIVTTAGGSYQAGEIYYDDGSQLRLVATWKGQHITIGNSDLTGSDLSFQANGVYAAHSASPPYDWTLKGDGAPEQIGYIRFIEVPIGTNSSYQSTTAIPDGSRIVKVETNVTTPYSSGATVQVSLETGVILQPTDENYPPEADLYVSDLYTVVGSGQGGKVKVDIGGGPTAGEGMVLVAYIERTLV